MRIAGCICMVFNFLISVSTLGQEPDWEINPSNFSSSMVILGVIADDDQELSNENDMIAAFINGELAGVTNLALEESVDRHLGLLIVYSNSDNDEISFKFYNSTDGTQVDVPGKLTFEIDGLIGNALNPYKWADKPVNTKSQLLSFDFENSIGRTIIDGTTVSVNIPQGSDMDLTASFELSEGAVARVGTNFQVSGTTSNDYSNPLEFVVVSEDGRFSTVYNIIVTEVVVSGLNDSHLSRLTVYPNPSSSIIKVGISDSSIHDELEVLDLNGRLVAKEKIIKSFDPIRINVSSLKNGTYVLKLGNNYTKFFKR